MGRKRYWFVYALQPEGGDRYLGKVLQATSLMAELRAKERWRKSLREGEKIRVFTQTAL